MAFFSSVDLPSRKSHFTLPLESCENHGLILWSGLPVYCHQGCLAHLSVAASAPCLPHPFSSWGWSWGLFLIFSETFLFLWAFCLSCQIFHDFLCSSSSSLWNIVCPLFPLLFSLTELPGGSFQSVTWKSESPSCFPQQLHHSPFQQAASSTLVILWDLCLLVLFCLFVCLFANTYPKGCAAVTHSSFELPVPST
jgi:hypothetical protein